MINHDSHGTRTRRSSRLAARRGKRTSRRLRLRPLGSVGPRSAAASARVALRLHAVPVLCSRRSTPTLRCATLRYATLRYATLLHALTCLAVSCHSYIMPYMTLHEGISQHSTGHGAPSAASHACTGPLQHCRGRDSCNAHRRRCQRACALILSVGKPQQDPPGSMCMYVCVHAYIYIYIYIYI